MEYDYDDLLHYDDDQNYKLLFLNISLEVILQ